MVVQCTWKSSDGRSILDAICWSDGSENVDVEDEVKAENCLLLEAPDNGTSGYLTVPACQLLISCDPPNQIQHVSVLSEARVMEVYGHHGEYLRTVRNELLEVVEDMAVFRGDVLFERPLNVCSLKFACLRSKSEMWLYGVKVTFSKADNVLDQTKIPFAEVERRLKEVGLKLSDKAEAFKQLVEKYQSSGLNHQDIGSMINLLQMSNLIKERSASPEDHSNRQGAISDPNSNLNLEALRNQTNELRSPEIISAYVDESPVIQPSRPSSFQRYSEQTQTDEVPPGLEDNLKIYIAEKIEELNKNLLEKIQKSFQEIEAKLMCKLDEIESFVKPHGS